MYVSRHAFALTLLVVFACIASPNEFFRGYTSSSRGSNQNSKPESNSSSSVDYYTLLGINKDSANISDIKRAYRQKAMKLHPDKGGDAEDFKYLNEAYEVLSDPAKKKVYDLYGKQGVSNGEGMGGMGGMDFEGFPADFADLFQGFTSGFSGSRFSMPLIYTISMTLEELYRGQTVEVELEGNAVEVVIEAGMYAGTELRGELTDRRGNERELIFVVKEQEHPMYKRLNADLYTELELSLSEALLGFERELVFLDGSTFIVKSQDGHITGPGDVLIIHGKGMPIYCPRKRANGGFGRMFLRVKVAFPKMQSLSWVSKESRAQLKQFLLELDGDGDSWLSASTASTASHSTTANSNKRKFDSTPLKQKKSSIEKQRVNGPRGADHEACTSEQLADEDKTSGKPCSPDVTVVIGRKGSIASFGQAGRAEAAAAATSGSHHSRFGGGVPSHGHRRPGHGFSSNNPFRTFGGGGAFFF